MSQVMGEYSLMREDVLMIIMFNVVGVAMPFPFLFKMKFHFTNRQLLLNAALVVAACNFLIMWTDSVPVMCILAYIAGFFKLCGTFECMSTIQPGIEEIKYFILHQSNYRISESIAKRLKLPMEKFPANLERYGNTSGASVPILLDELNREGKLKPGDKLLLAGFGAGLTWGTTLLEW